MERKQKQMRRYENVKIDKLKPYENNARTHSEAQVEKIANSIKEFGFINPVIIDSDYGIIAGHGRVLGAQKIGMDKVPCLFVEDLTEAQKRAYILADNKLALDAGWDDEILKQEIKALDDLNFDISLTGFDLDEFDFTQSDIEFEEDEYDIDANIPEIPKAKYGDIPLFLSRTWWRYPYESVSLDEAYSEKKPGGWFNFVLENNKSMANVCYFDRAKENKVFPSIVFREDGTVDPEKTLYYFQY